MIDSLKIMLNMINVEYNIYEFDNCYLLINDVTTFMLELQQFNEEIKTLIDNFLDKYNYIYNKVHYGSIRVDTKNHNVLHSENSCKEDKYEGFVIYKGSESYDL